MHFPVLIGDIGGTNARFRLLHENGSAENFDPFETADHATISGAITAAIYPQCSELPKTIILAAAGPITQHGLKLTNCAWNIEPDTLLPETGVEQLILFNDFDAQALALPGFSANDVTMVGPKSNDWSRKATKAVLGPGTGLGVAGLIWADERWVPLGGEGGHVDLGPRTKREEQIWVHLDRFEGRVSAESILSGGGLLNAYRALCLVDSAEAVFSAPAEVSVAALAETNSQAVEALSLFCACLGRVAGDLALTTMAKGGVFIGGGITSRILPFLEKSAFRHEFEDKAPHRKILASIPTCVVTTSLPALDGLTAYARAPETYLITREGRSWQATAKTDL